MNSIQPVSQGEVLWKNVMKRWGMGQDGLLYPFPTGVAFSPNLHPARSSVYPQCFLSSTSSFSHIPFTGSPFSWIYFFRGKFLRMLFITFIVFFLRSKSSLVPCLFSLSEIYFTLTYFYFTFVVRCHVIWIWWWTLECRESMVRNMLSFLLPISRHFSSSSISSLTSSFTSQMKNIKLHIVTDMKDRTTHVDRQNLWGRTTEGNILTVNRCIEFGEGPQQH